MAPPRSTKTSDRGIPRRSRTWRSMFVTPPRSTKISDRGIPRRSRAWDMFSHVLMTATAWLARYTNCGHDNSHSACSEFTSYASSTDATDGPPTAWVRKENACDANVRIVNGAVGTCTDTLASGSTCQPECDSGYTVSGTSSCTAGNLIAATCSPSPFAASFADGAALKVAVDECLGGGDPTGVACEMDGWDVSLVTDMSSLFSRQRISSTRISRRGIPRRSRTCGTCFFAPAPSTKTSDRGIPRRSPIWGPCSIAPTPSTKTSDRGIPHRSRTWSSCSIAPTRSTKISDRGIPRRSRT